jgi:hypothetical protein
VSRNISKDVVPTQMTLESVQDLDNAVCRTDVVFATSAAAADEKRVVANFEMKMEG